MQKEEKVVLIDNEDNVLGLMGKMQAHVDGVLHRAFSVFVFNNKGETLLQKRALSKYHSPGLWTNTCCSHPRESESYLSAAYRRIEEEMGFTCPLEYQFNFTYKADVGGGLIEHERDHVFTGTFNGKPKLNPEEVCDYKWISLDELEEDLKKNPTHYTEWFKIILKEYIQYLKNK